MAENLEDYFRSIIEGQLLTGKLPLLGGTMTGGTRLLLKRKEIIEMEERLKTHREEFELKRLSLQQRRKNVWQKEEKLKDSLLNFDKFLKENDAKRSRGLKKAHKERLAVSQKEAEIERLREECTLLEERRQTLRRRVERKTLYWSFLERVLKMAEFEEVRELLARFETLLATKEQLCQRESEVQEQADSQRGALRTYLDQQGCLLLQKNNLLSALQTQLDRTRSDALRWESKWNHIQNTAAKETLLLGQIKMVTLNLYQMAGGELGGEEGVAVDDTEIQLDKIQRFIQRRTDIVNDIEPQTQ